MSRIEKEREHFNKLAPQAEAIWGWTTRVGAIRAQRRADYLIELGRLNDTERILEIGCGTGLFTEKVCCNTKASICAVDLSENLLAIAKQKNLGQVHFQAGDAMQLKFADCQFNAVFGNSILHHLDMEVALQEVFRVLKKGGRAVFAEPNMLNPQIFLQKNIPWLKKYLGDSPDETAIVRWKLAKIMKKIGFVQVRIFPFDFLHPTTPHLLIGLVQKLGVLLEKAPVVKEIAGSVILYGEK